MLTCRLRVYYRNETLADMSRAAWRLKQRKIAIQCAELTLEGNIVSKILKVRTSFCGLNCNYNTIMQNLAKEAHYCGCYTQFSC
jgi:hypothetical protein